MKKLFRLATLLLAFATLGFVGCEEPEAWIDKNGVGINASVKSTSVTTATLEVQTAGLSKIAWIARTAEESAPASVFIFKNGSQMDVTNGTHTVEVKQLSANTTYTIYIAGEIAATADLSDVYTLQNVKTTDFDTEGVTVRDVTYDGFTLDIKVPESVKEEDHLIKWSAADLYLFNRNKIGSHGVVPDTNLMNWNDSDAGWGHLYFNTSTTLTITEMNSFAIDENGSPNYDYHYYEALVPGQPEVFILGEFAFGQDYGGGWGWGYYEPMFDRAAWSSALAKNGGEIIDETPYWDGMYKHMIIKTKEPEKLDDSLLQVELDIRTDDAIINVQVDDSIAGVQVMVLDEDQHALAYKWLGESYEHFQWFATSYVGMMEGATDFYMRGAGIDGNGRLRTALSQYLLNVSQTSKYWVWVVGLAGTDDAGNMNGSKQVCWNMNGFNLKPTTKPAPTIEVTAVEPSKPNTAAYKIFCPSAAEGNGVTKGYYISNYEREWLSANMTAQQILDSYAWGDPYCEFLPTEYDIINGKDGGDGLVIEFPSRPNENYHFAAVFTNSEGTRTYSDAVICRTYETPVEKVESAYFESLKGEWTASALVRFSKLRTDIDPEDETLTDEEKYEQFEKTHTCTITIGDTTYPETLSETVYETFEKHGVSRDKTDAYYAQFCEAVDLFNETNRDHNRILLNGFNFAGEMLEHLPYFNYQSAYDLFISDTYNGASYTMPVYEFGPKWYFEVMEDGTLAVPFNSTSFEPMASWCISGYNQLQEIHLIAYEPTMPMAAGYIGQGGYLGSAQTGYFPVEVSEDGNTITIKPYQHEQLPGLDFYPNVGVFYGYDGTGEATYSMALAIISEITLTRGAAPAPARAKAVSGNNNAPVEMEVEAMNEIRTSIKPKMKGFFNENNRVEMVGPNKDLTPEQKHERWMTVRKGVRK